MFIGNDQGKIKAHKRPYMKLFTSDYRDGTARLSFELQGFYFRVLTILHDGDTVPSDARSLGVMLQCDPRKASRLARELIACGKLYEANGELRNRRIDRDLGETSIEVRSDVEEKSPELRSDIAEKSERTIQKSESNQEGSKNNYGEDHFHIHSQKKEEQAAPPEQEPARPSPSVAALPPSDLDALHGRLIEACNGALDNPVNCMGLLSLATPQMWIDRGADLERDVIPTLQAAGKKYHGKRIRDWSYFTPMVSEAVEKRTAAMPKAGSGSAAKESARARRAKIFEKLQQEGRV